MTIRGFVCLLSQSEEVIQELAQVARSEPYRAAVLVVDDVDALSRSQGDAGALFLSVMMLLARNVSASNVVYSSHRFEQVVLGAGWTS
jgi:hypothetical protein